MKIFITGGSGFLGGYLIIELLKNDSIDKIYILSRSGTKIGTNNPRYEHDKRIEIIAGDICDPNVVYSHEVKQNILNEITHIIHCAALYDLEACESDCMLHNVVGTQNMIWFSKNAKNLKEFHLASTIAVAGNFNGRFPENELPDHLVHDNAYAKSKYLSEKLFREAQLSYNHLACKKRIWRLGILIGDSISGKFEKIDGPYYFLKKLGDFCHYKIFKKLKFFPIPYNPDTILPFIACDLAARVLGYSLSNKEIMEKDLLCFHVVSKDRPNAYEFLQDVFQFFDLKMKPIKMIKNPFNRLIIKGVGIPTELLGYFNSKCDYEINNLAHHFPNIELPLYSSYKKNIFSYAVRKFKK